MKYDTRRLNDSYALLVAEESPQYDADASAQSTVQLLSSSAPSVESSPIAGAAPSSTTPSTLPPNLAQQGQSLRLAAALIESVSDAAGDRKSSSEKLRTLSRRALGRTAPPETDEAVLARLKQLVRLNDRNLAEQLSLLLHVDELQLWRKAGCRGCIHWMDLMLGIGRVAALERLRVARVLRSLPVIESLFSLGRLSWSKVRELTRVANAENEQALTAAALDLSASETVELCWRWRHGDVSTNSADDCDSEVGTDEDDARRALLAHEERSLTWRQRDAFTTRITLDLPVELAAEFLKAMEAQEDELREDDVKLSSGEPFADTQTNASKICAESLEVREQEASETQSAQDATNEQEVHDTQETQTHESTPRRRTPRQLRADAAVLMSAHALAHAGEPVAAADRYRVFVNLDARVLADDVEPDSIASGELPPERPSIPGYGPIAAATARRLASRARLTVIATDTEGEIVATGVDTRLFAPNAVRAITARDRCCQMPGCTRTRWLQAHHVIPWAEGGKTTVSNGCLMCSSCHRHLHEGRLRLERVTSASVELSDDSLLSLTPSEQQRARKMCAALQRFRLVRTDGRVVAGPGRSSGCGDNRRSAGDQSRCDQSDEIDDEIDDASNNERGNEFGNAYSNAHSNENGESPFPRGNERLNSSSSVPLSSIDQLERFRIASP